MNGQPKKLSKKTNLPTRAGRPPIELDPEAVGKLAALLCTMEEIAGHFNCSVDMLERNFSEVIKRGRERGKESLRRLQWKSAMEGNVSMQIWLGKQILKQREPKDIALSIDSKDIEELFDNTRDPLNSCTKPLELTNQLSGT